MPGSFFDTNVLAYLFLNDGVKAARAEELLQGGGCISVQVLNELANVARRKARLRWAETHELLSFVRRLLHVEINSVVIHEKGLSLADRYNFAIYDAMIVAAALAAGCSTLWSEDMQTGLLVDGKLRLQNPFTPSPITVP